MGIKVRNVLTDAKFQKHWAKAMKSLLLSQIVPEIISLSECACVRKVSYVTTKHLLAQDHANRFAIVGYASLPSFAFTTAHFAPQVTGEMYIVVHESEYAGK